MMLKILLPCCIILSSLFSCIAPSHFYTAETLEAGKISVTGGVDFTYIPSFSFDEESEGGFPIIFPSVGGAVGLTDFLELDLKYYPLKSGEANLRCEITPKSWESFHVSLEGGMGNLITSFKNNPEYYYFMQGITMSFGKGNKKPYFHLSGYEFTNDDYLDYGGKFVYGVEFSIDNNIKIYPEFSLSLNNMLFPSIFFCLGIKKCF